MADRHPELTKEVVELLVQSGASPKTIVPQLHKFARDKRPAVRAAAARG